MILSGENIGILARKKLTTTLTLTTLQTMKTTCYLNIAGDFADGYDGVFDKKFYKKKRIMEYQDKILLGDCLDVMKGIPSNSIDLIFTSPPYADRRKNTYGGIHPDEYVKWFLPRSAEMLRILKPDGTFILNIKEKAEKGERHTYVIELILALRKQDWLWTEEFIWHKRNCFPGKWPNRFRDAWEHCYQFNKKKKFNMYQEAVMVAMGDWKEKRMRKLSETDKERDESKVGSGFGKKIANWLERDKAYPTNVLHIEANPDTIAIPQEEIDTEPCNPTNVLHLSTECSNKKHSATFPKALPEWFIKLFTKEGDSVLDPFNGSGTTTLIAQRLKRKFIGIEVLQEFVDLANSNQDKLELAS
jgi:site-specific DNA-methyltransferase (adenine-specific)